MKEKKYCFLTIIFIIFFVIATHLLMFISITSTNKREIIIKEDNNYKEAYYEIIESMYCYDGMCRKPEIINGYYVIPGDAPTPFVKKINQCRK